MKLLTCTALLLGLGAAGHGDDQAYWDLARARGRIYEESGTGALRLLKGWYEFKRDPGTGLYSRGRVWEYANEAADHYGSMVPIAYFVDTPAIAKGGTLHRTLATSIALCSTASGIPAPYDLRKKVKLDPGPGQEGKLAFGASEWCKDGLMRIVESIGIENDWYRELARLTTALMVWMERGGLEHGVSQRDITEIHGNMLQTLGRLYAMSGDEKYLRWAEGIADQYLLADPIQKIRKVGLTDHGNEAVVGLGEIFALECQLKRPRARQYQPALRNLLDRILEAGRDPANGFWYFAVDLATGEKEIHPTLKMPHAWGYIYFACENYDRGTGEDRYRAAIEKPVFWFLRNRPIWQHWDNWSDSYESMIILWKRYPEWPRVFSWLQFMTERHRSCWMEEYGPYSGDHDDGSTGRRLVLHMNLASRGVRTIPYIEKLRLGAFEKNGELYLHAEADVPWSGRLCFDWPRSEHKAAKIDWARINETQEWYTVRPQLRYKVTVDGAAPVTVSGRELISGFPLALKPGQGRRIQVSGAAAR
ncbi:MAG: hypothetical protein ACE15B_03430 [Bryobacteraceae bacterium]